MIRRDTVTVLLPAWTNDRGTLVPDFDNAGEVTEREWLIQPLASEEQTEMLRQGVRASYRGHGPHSSVVTSRSRIVCDGTTYEVTGAPKRFRSVSGSLDHIEVMLEVVEG